jgi:tetratricopeptide (TPR) repeat protein
VADADGAELAAALARLLGPRADELVPWLASMLGIEEAPEAAMGLPPELVQTRVHDAFAAVLERIAADGPVALAFEDLHWADASSAALVERMLELTERAAVLLVLTGRLDADRPLAALTRTAAGELSHRCAEIRLAALDADAQRALLGELLGAAELPPAIEERVLERAEGNPLYLEQLVRELVDSGAVRQEGGRWRFDPDVPVEIPETVEKIVLARVDRLDERSQEVLGAAAVIGRQFSLSLLKRLVGDAAAAVRDLQRRELVREVRRWPEPEYRFSHVLIREAVYGTLLRRRREELHRAAAEELASVPAEGRSDEHEARLAQHWAAAGEHEPALASYTRAAERAEAISAPAEAGKHWESARAAADRLGLDARDARLRRAVLGWAVAQRASGELEERRPALEATLEGARAAGDRRDEMRALLELDLSLRASGEWPRVTEVLEDALAIAEELDDPVAQTNALRRLAITHSNLLRLDDALALAGRARAVAEVATGDDCLEAALDAMKLAALYAGDMPLLDETGAKLAGIQRRDGKLHVLAWALAEWAFAPMAAGRFDEAERMLDEALAITGSIGDRLSRPMFLAHRSWLERSRGRYGAAIAAGREAVAEAEELGFAEWGAWAAAALGWVFLELNAPSSALPVLERGVALAERGDALAQRIRCSALLAEAAVLAGEADRASHHADIAERLLAEISAPEGGAWLWGGHAVVALANVRLARGDRERARVLAEPLLAPARAAAWHEVAGSAALVLGRAASRTDEAEELLRAAIADADAGGLPGLEWRARLAFAHVLERDGRTDNARPHAARARALVETLAGELPEAELRVAMLDAARERRGAQPVS